MRRSLKELDLGLKGELTITSDMEDLSDSLFFDQVIISLVHKIIFYIMAISKVPPSWTKLAYASLNGLSAWYADLLLRIKELEGWTSDFNLPSSVWLPGFFNPQSFLTAIMQSTARKNELPLDKMCLTCEVTKKYAGEVQQNMREGAYIHGLFSFNIMTLRYHIIFMFICLSCERKYAYVCMLSLELSNIYFKEVN